MNIIETPIKDLLIIAPKVWEDTRGYFFESFNAKYFEELQINATFVQDNQSLSSKGTLRGLHAQAPPHAQGKLVRVIKGSVLDVAVDIRKNSATFGQSFSILLSEQNHQQLWIPPGFLHGFLTLEDETIFTYKVTNYYDKNSEIGVKWNDPHFNINWTAYLSEQNYICSEKDNDLPYFSDFKSPF
jgi:dTDP-4-dehydrorhamnose 3,5-epimerase